MELNNCIPSMIKKTLMDLNDMLFWNNLGNRKTRGRWAHIFSELREENNQWMLDCFISKDVIVGCHRQLVLPLPGIQGIYSYAPFRFLRQFGRKQVTPREAYYHIYVYDIGDNKVDNAKECRGHTNEQRKHCSRSIYHQI